MCYRGAGDKKETKTTPVRKKEKEALAALLWLFLLSSLLLVTGTSLSLGHDPAAGLGARYPEDGKRSTGTDRPTGTP